METYFRSEQAEPFPQDGEIQNGDTRNHQDIPPARGVGYFHRFHRRLLPYTNTGMVKEISEISCTGSDIPVQGSALWSVHSALGVHCSGQGGEIDGHTPGYKDPPVPRRLVGEGQIPLGLSHSGSCENMPKSWLAGEFGKVGTGTQADFRFCRLPVRPQGRPGPTDTGPVAEPSGQDTKNIVTTDLPGPAIYVPDRFSYREASSLRPTSYKTHTVASQKQLARTRVSGKSYPDSQAFAPSLTMVARRSKCSHRTAITPDKICSANLYRRIKRRVGRSLRRTHRQRGLVTARKQAAHKLPGTKGSFSSLETISRPLYRQDSSCGNRQHDGCFVHKQGGGHEVRPTVRPIMENLNLVYQEPSDTQSPTHPRPSEYGSRQVIQDRPDHSNRVVPSSRGFPGNLQRMASTTNRLICYKVQQQAASICVPSTGSPGHGSGCTQSAMGGSGRIRLPTNSHLGQSGGEIAGHPMHKNHSDCPGVAQHALVLGPGGHVQPDSPEPAQSAQPVNTAFQSDPSQKSDKPKSPCMAHRASAIKGQGFSEAVAARIEAP